MRRLNTWIIAMGCALLAGAAGSSQAQPAWPARPIVYVVPFAVGGNTDTLARLLSQIEAEAKLAGEEGQALALRVQRGYGAKPERVDLVLEPAPRELVSAELVAVSTSDGATKKAALVHLRGFRKGTGEEFKQRLEQLRRTAGPAGLAAVVLDLRGNPGGEVDEALVVADLFVAEGILTRTRGRGGKILREEFLHPAVDDFSLRRIDRGPAGFQQAVDFGIAVESAVVAVGRQAVGVEELKIDVRVDDADPGQGE